MSIFLKTVIQKIKQYQSLIWVLTIIMIINMIYYIYWLYYISYLFQLHPSHGICLNYYNETEYQIITPLPTLELNLSLFELQTALTWVMAWTFFFVAPYLIAYYIVSRQDFSHKKNYLLMKTSTILIINFIFQFVYIPFFISLSKEYYTIYQMTQESFHLNIEYNVVILLKQLIIYHGTMGLIYILGQTNAVRMALFLCYLVLIPFDQPIMILLTGLIVYTITQEILTFLNFIQKNYLKKIAGHCTGIEK
jgi:hypothetical protein